MEPTETHQNLSRYDQAYRAPLQPSVGPAGPIQPAEATGHGFSLNLTFRLWPFMLAIDVTRLSQADEPSEQTI